MIDTQGWSYPLWKILSHIWKTNIWFWFQTTEFWYVRRLCQLQELKGDGYHFVYVLKCHTLHLYCVLYNSKIDEVYLHQWFESSQPRCQTTWMSELSDDFNPSHLHPSERSQAKTCPTKPISSSWPIEIVRNNKLLLLFEATNFMGDLLALMNN